jgi:hypothetical protein
MRGVAMLQALGGWAAIVYCFMLIVFASRSRLWNAVLLYQVRIKIIIMNKVTGVVGTSARILHGCGSWRQSAIAIIVKWIHSQNSAP